MSEHGGSVVTFFKETLATLVFWLGQEITLKPESACTERNFLSVYLYLFTYTPTFWLDRLKWFLFVSKIRVSFPLNVYKTCFSIRIYLIMVFFLNALCIIIVLCSPFIESNFQSCLTWQRVPSTSHVQCHQSDTDLLYYLPLLYVFNLFADNSTHMRKPILTDGLFNCIFI